MNRAVQPVFWFIAIYYTHVKKIMFPIYCSGDKIAIFTVPKAREKFFFFLQIPVRIISLTIWCNVYFPSIEGIFSIIKM